MKTIKNALSFLASVIIIVISVLVLVLVSVISMIFNAVLFILMVSALAIPMFGNMLSGKAAEKKALTNHSP